MKAAILISVLAALTGPALVYLKFCSPLHLSLTGTVLPLLAQQARSTSVPHLEKKSTVDVVYPEGEVTGLSKTVMESFRGIPFAQAPIGNLRLRPPRRLVQNVGKLDATMLGPSCPQLLLSSGGSSIAAKYLSKLATHPMFQKAVNVKEDCLTLNIQRPTGTNSSSHLPVIYWFFGGAFEVQLPYSPRSGRLTLVLPG